VSVPDIGSLTTTQAGSRGCHLPPQIHYITRLFENAGEILEPFSDAQVRQGFVYLEEWVEFVGNLRTETIPFADRQRCVHLVFNLFQGCFARRCAADAYQLNEDEGKRLTHTCNWFWNKWYSLSENVELRRDIKEVQERIKALNLSYLSA
jgi:hypothetical protein